MSLREGLVSLQKARNEKQQEQEAAQAPAAAEARAEAPSKPLAVRERREAFTSRLRPSQRRGLRQLALDLEDELGGRVSIEDILEALVTELQDSGDLRQRVTARVAERVRLD